MPELGCTLGVLALTNFGGSRELRIDGVPVGRMLAPAEGRPKEAGSCIVVVATDAPLAPAQLERVARRAGLGLARTGSVAYHGSGEIFVAFATTDERSVPDDATRSAVPRHGRRDRGGCRQLALGGEGHDRPRGPRRQGAARTTRCSSCSSRLSGCAGSAGSGRRTSAGRARRRGGRAAPGAGSARSSHARGRRPRHRSRRPRSRPPRQRRPRTG